MRTSRARRPVRRGQFHLTQGIRLHRGAREGALDLDAIVTYLSGLDDEDEPGEASAEPENELSDGDEYWHLDWGRVLGLGDDAGSIEQMAGWWADARLPEGLAPGTVVGQRDTVKGSINWDVCAWYASISFHGHGFGIFIRQDCLVRLAHRLGPWVFAPGHRLSPLDTFHLLASAFFHFFLHEQLHHKVEAFGIRLAVSERRAAYARYSRDAYQPARRSSPSLLLEEAIACADSYRRIDEPRYANVLGRRTIAGTRDFLDHYFPVMPDGYSRAPGYLSDLDFDLGEAELQAAVHEATWAPAPDWKRWHLSTFMLRSIYSIESRIWTIVSPGSVAVLPTTGPAATASTRLVERYLARLGYRKSGRGKGSHEVWSKPGAPTITVPRRKDLTPGFLSDLAAKLGLSSTVELVMAIRAL